MMTVAVSKLPEGTASNVFFFILLMPENDELVSQAVWPWKRSMFSGISVSSFILISSFDKIMYTRYPFLLL